jgi:metallo-beta-lactamase class B
MRTLTIFLTLAAGAAALQRGHKADVRPSAAEEQQMNRPFPAHKVIANIYFVGTTALASYLIATPEGHILINTGFESSVPLIRASVEKLGFKFTDIRIILDSHAHIDHVAGNAMAKELSGAKVYVMKGDEEVVRTGGLGDFHYSMRWQPSPVDKVLHDGEEVTLGGSTLVARLTPGHTRGNTTWTMAVTENGRRYDVVIVGSPFANPDFRLVNNPKYPEIVDDYEKSFRFLKALHCDIFLGPHSGYYKLAQKYKRIGEKDNPFIDPEGYHAFIEERERVFHEQLAEQKR